jgi:hypothetical protein
MPRGATFFRTEGSLGASLSVLSTLRGNGRTPIEPTVGRSPGSGDNSGGEAPAPYYCLAATGSSLKAVARHILRRRFWRHYSSRQGESQAAKCYTDSMQRSQHLRGSVVAPEAAAPPFQPIAALLLAGLVTALVTVVSGLVVRFVPTWRPGYLIAAIFLVAGEAALVRYRMLRGQHLEVGALRYLAAELFLLAVVMRVVVTLSQGLATFAASIEDWLRSPLAAFDNVFILCMVIGLVCALIVRLGLNTLAEIAPRPVAPATDESLDSAFFRADLSNQQKQAFNRLSTALAWGGGLVLVALIGQVANIERFSGESLRLAPASGLAGIVYLLCALLLYSRARLMLLQSRWQTDGAIVDPGVMRQWPALSLGLVLCVGIGALLLPRSYGLGMLDIFRTGALILANIFTALFTYVGLMLFGVVGLLLTIPAALLALIALLLGRSEDSTPVSPLQPPPLPEAPPPAEPAALGPGIIFWICMTLLAGYTLLIVLRRQAWAVALWKQLRTGPLERILSHLRHFWSGAQTYMHAVSHALTYPADAAASDEPASTVRRSRLRSLNPAELVRAFYRTMLEQADQRGLPRRSAQTPYEFARQLEEHLPDAAEDVEALTETYVRAAYAPRPITRDDAARARRPFARLRRRLRK